MMRDHLIQFLYINMQNIRKNIYPYVSLLILMIGSNNKWETYIYIGFVVVSIFLITKSFFTWKNKTFIFHDQFVSVTSGVWQKSYQDIHYTKIKSLHTNHPFIKRLIGISDLTVETIGGEKISFVLSNKEINQIKSILRKEEKQEKIMNRSYRFSLLDYMLIASSNAKLFFASLPIFCTLLGQFSTHVLETDPVKQKQAAERSALDSFHILQQQFDRVGMEKMIMSICFIVVVMCIGSYLISVILTYLTYRKFSITREQSELKIEYGLFQKKVYTISVQDIRGMEVLQPPMYRLFGCAKLKVQSVSLHGEDSKTLFLLPIVKMKELEDHIHQYVPELEIPKTLLRSPKQALLYFVGFQFAWVVMIMGALTYLWHPLYYMFYGLPLFIVMGYNKWKCTGFSFSDSFVSHRTISWGVVKHTVFRKEFLQSKGYSQSKLQQWLALCDYDFSVSSEKVYDSFSADHLPQDFKDKFIEK